MRSVVSGAGARRPQRMSWFRRGVAWSAVVATTAGRHRLARRWISAGSRVTSRSVEDSGSRRGRVRKTVIRLMLSCFDGMRRVAARIWVHWASGNWNRSDQQGHAVALDSSNRGAAKRSRRRVRPGRRTGPAVETGAATGRSACPRTTTTSFGASASPATGLDLVRRLGRWVDRAVTSRSTCWPRSTVSGSG